LAAGLSSHFSHYISEALDHMRREEEEYNLAIWVVFDDKELAEMRSNVFFFDFFFLSLVNIKLIQKVVSRFRKYNEGACTYS
jgi:hypothetical protein